MAKPNMVTENDISRSEIRHQAIIQEHIFNVLPGGVILVPAWFGPAMQRELGPIAAQIENQKRMRKNRNALHAVVSNASAGATGLHEVAKTIPGAGPGLPGLVPPAPDLIPDVGAFSGPPFPATVADLRVLTELQLHDLSAFYNDSFGIIPGDALDEKLTKFQAYILGE